MSKRKIHFPKGEGIKIINKPSDANVNNSIYILPISKQTAEIIILDKVGNRRKIGFSMPDNLALTDILTPDGEITESGNVYLKEQIDNLLKTEKEERAAVDNALKNNIDTEAGIRETKDTELDEKIASVSSRLDNETNIRTQEDGTLNDKIINLQESVRRLSEWKSLMVDEDSDEVINTISDLINAFNDLPEGSNVIELLGKKVNIASIVDNLESELGNVPLSANQGRVLKTKIETLKGLIDTVNTELTKKLDKPTTTLSEPNLEYKYVAILDEQGNTKKMLAGDLGKNSANADLTTTGTRTFTQAHIYTHNTAGYHYYITGLPNKSADPTFNLLLAQNSNGQTAVSNGKAVLENLMASLPSVKDARTGNYDLNFSYQIVYNPNTKQIAVSDRPQIVSNYNVPSTITINHNLSNSAINLVYNGGEPNIPDNIRQAMERIKQMEQLPYTLFKPSDLVISTMPKSEYPASIRDTYTIPNDIWEMSQNGILQVKRALPVPPEFADDKYYFDNKYYTLTNAQFNIELPSNKDWVIRIQSLSLFHYIANAMSFEPNIGNHKSSLDDDMIVILHNTVTRFHPPGTRGEYGLSNWANSEVFFIKTGDIITIFIRNMFTGSIETAIIPYKDRYKYLTFKMANNGGGKEVFPNWLGVGRKFINIGYWIQP